jgi:hypothetical protein
VHLLVIDKHTTKNARYENITKMFAEQNILARSVKHECQERSMKSFFPLLILLAYIRRNQKYRPYFYQHVKSIIFLSDFN